MAFGSLTGLLILILIVAVVVMVVRRATATQAERPVSQQPVVQQPVVQQPAVTSGLAPGWYPDQNDPDLMRYFDGRVWTARAQPRN